MPGGSLRLKTWRRCQGAPCQLPPPSGNAAQGPASPLPYKSTRPSFVNTIQELMDETVGQALASADEDDERKPLAKDSMMKYHAAGESGVYESYDVIVRKHNLLHLGMPNTDTYWKQRGDNAHEFGACRHLHCEP